MSQAHPGSVVVGVDGSPHGDAALTWAVAQAQLAARPLLVVHAAGGLSSGELLGGPTESAQLRSMPARRVTEEAVAVARRIAPGLRVDAATPVGDARRVLLDLSVQAAMVVVGTRGHGSITSLLLGSVSQAVVSHAHSSVAVVRPRTEPPRGVVVGLALDGTDDASLEFAAQLAAAKHLALDAVHAWRADDPLAVAPTQGQRIVTMRRHERALAEALAGVGEKFPDIQVNRHLPEQRAVDALVAWSPGADCVVVGSRGLTGLHRLMGSVSRAVIEHAHSTVVVVRA